MGASQSVTACEVKGPATSPDLEAASASASTGAESLVQMTKSALTGGVRNSSAAVPLVLAAGTSTTSFVSATSSSNFEIDGPPAAPAAAAAAAITLPLIPYALITKDRQTVLADYISSGVQGDRETLGQAVKDLLSQKGTSEVVKSYKLDDHLSGSNQSLHYCTAEAPGEVWFACLASGQKVGLPSEFVKELKDAFCSASETERENFVDTMAQKMTQFNARADQERAAQEKALEKSGEVMRSLSQTMQGLEDRQERLDTLQRQSANLTTASVHFRGNTAKIKRNAWCQSVKVNAVGGALVTAVVLLVLMSSCGIKFDHC